MGRAARSSKSLRLVLGVVVASTVNKCSEPFWSKSSEGGEEPGAPEIVVGKGGGWGHQVVLGSIMSALGQYQVTAR